MKLDKFKHWYFNCWNSFSRTMVNSPAVEIFKREVDAFLKEMLLLSNSGVFWNCIPSLCHAKWSQQSLLGSQLWIMKGHFVGFLQNMRRFLWQVSAFGGVHISAKIIKYHWYDQIFGKYWYAIYFEYIWITSCKGFGNYFFTRWNLNLPENRSHSLPFSCRDYLPFMLPTGLQQKYHCV